MVDHNELIRSAYKDRAVYYDDGWHADLAQDFVTWLDPQPGEYVLDLACGTGLLTIPQAVRVGKEGRVLAVDLTKEMIGIAQKKEVPSDASEIRWIVEDITSEALLSHPDIRAVIDERGGFDIISICSALVLLPYQHSAVVFWVKRLLKKGGRLIVDVTTETTTLQLLRTYYLPKALGRSFDLATGRLWIKGKHSLEGLLQTAGLAIEQSVLTKSYAGETWYADDKETALDVLREEVKGSLKWVEKEGKLEEAELVWPELWQSAVVPGPEGHGAVYSGHQLVG